MVRSEAQWGGTVDEINDALLRQAQHGDTDAFQRLVAVYTPLVWRTALVFLRDRLSAEDVLQEVWLDVWRGLARFREPEPFRPWLLTIVANRCRKTTRRKRVEVISLDTATIAGITTTNGLSEPVEAAAIRKETIVALRQAIADLAPEQQRVIELRYFADLDLEEIAIVTGAPLGTVKSRLHRAVQALRVKGRIRLVDSEQLA